MYTVKGKSEKHKIQILHLHALFLQFHTNMQVLAANPWSGKLPSDVQIYIATRILNFYELMPNVVFGKHKKCKH